jgi:hypothetical protein
MKSGEFLATHFDTTTMPRFPAMTKPDDLPPTGKPRDVSRKPAAACTFRHFSKLATGCAVCEF